MTFRYRRNNVLAPFSIFIMFLRNLLLQLFIVECHPKPFFSIFYLTDLNAESFGHAAQQLKSIDDSQDFFKAHNSRCC